MGLLRFSNFSSIPNLFKKIQARREQEERFTPTWLEFASKNFEIVSRVSGEGTLFTVPVDRILFITSIHHTASRDNSVNTASASLGITGPQGDLSNITFAAANVDAQTITHNYTMPIRVEAGRSILVQSGVGVESAAIMWGFLIKSSQEIV